MPTVDPQTLGAIRDLRLSTRRIVNQFVSGCGSSGLIASGVEFDRHRGYQPGDDPRHVDWKLHARTDRYYIKDSQNESLLTIQFVLDGTASMKHEESGVSKWEYGCQVIAALAYLTQLQGDSFGLWIPQEKNNIELMPSRDKAGWARLVDALESTQPDGKWPASSINKQRRRHRTPRLIVMVSDYQQEKSEIETFIKARLAERDEVILFHLLGRNELEFTYTGSIELEDLETGQILEISADRVRTQYLEKMHRHLKAIRSRLSKVQVDYQQIIASQPLHRVLRAFLHRRERIRRKA